MKLGNETRPFDPDRAPLGDSKIIYDAWAILTRVGSPARVQRSCTCSYEDSEEMTRHAPLCLLSIDPTATEV